MDKAALEQRFDRAAEGVVHDAVLEGRGGDQPALPLAHHEAAVGARLVGAILQPLLKPEQPDLGVELVGGHRRPAALAAPGRQIGRPEIVAASEKTGFAPAALADAHAGS